MAIRVNLAGSETPPGVSLADLRGVGVSFTAPGAALSPPRGPEGWETGNGVLFAVPLAMVGLGQVGMGVGSCVVRFLEWGHLGAGLLSLESLSLPGRVGRWVGTCVIRFLEWGRLGAGSLLLVVAGVVVIVTVVGFVLTAAAVVGGRFVVVVITSRIVLHLGCSLHAGGGWEGRGTGIGGGGCA